MLAYILSSFSLLIANMLLFSAIAFMAIFFNSSQKSSNLFPVLPPQYRCTVALHLLSKDRIISQNKAQYLQNDQTDDKVQDRVDYSSRGLNKNQQFEYIVYVPVFFL